MAACDPGVEVGTHGSAVKVAVGELFGVTVAEGHRVLVAVGCGVRVGGLVAVAVGIAVRDAVGEATRLGTAVPGADIVTITGNGTGVSEGLGVTKAI